MKRSFLFVSILSLSLVSFRISAQPTTAMDFNRPDCNGVMRHLFDDLDSGNVVVLEFFMDSCSPCVLAAHALEAMEHTLKTQNNINFISYASGFTDVYSKPQIANWVSVNRLRNIPIDSGKTMMNYYGGFGMPTIVILAGRDHRVLYDVRGFTPIDTTAAEAAIMSYATGIEDIGPSLSSLSIYPNPVSQSVNIELLATENAAVTVTIMTTTGQIVAAMPEEKINAGKYRKQIDLSAVPAGNYLIKIASDRNAISRQFAIIK